MESLGEQCGDDATFTGNAVIDGVPAEIVAPFLYRRTIPFPESRPDSEIRVRVSYDGGFVVCRIPMPTQPAIDMEVVVEYITADGAFDEAHHTYLRRNNFGFVDGWSTASSAPFGGLDGSYTIPEPPCLDPGDYAFSTTWLTDGSVMGRISRICETDIFVDVGTFDL